MFNEFKDLSKKEIEYLISVCISINEKELKEYIWIDDILVTMAEDEQFQSGVNNEQI